MTTREKVTRSEERAAAPRPPARTASQFEIGFGVALVALAVVVAVTYGDNLIDMLSGLAGFSTGALVLLLVAVGGVLFAAALPALSQETDASTALDMPALRGTTRQNRALEILYGEKQRLLRAIRDLDFDYDMGKLTDDIYTEQRIYLIRQTIAVMRRIDMLEAEIQAQQDRIAAALAAYRTKH